MNTTQFEDEIEDIYQLNGPVEHKTLTLNSILWQFRRERVEVFTEEEVLLNSEI
ncbi:MAG: hypothetical protein AABW75_01005 [Nanoarchaeota archaeon]